MHTPKFLFGTLDVPEKSAYRQLCALLRWHNVSTRCCKLQEVKMEHDEAKIDEMVLALLYLTMFNDGVEMRSWKGHDWSAMGRLYKNGYISDPRNKAHSVGMTDVGAKRARELFEKNFLREL